MEVVMKVSTRQPCCLVMFYFVILLLVIQAHLLEKENISPYNLICIFFYVHVIFQYNLQYFQKPIFLFVVWDLRHV